VALVPLVLLKQAAALVPLVLLTQAAALVLLVLMRWRWCRQCC
jgi:hypothetical protein